MIQLFTHLFGGKSLKHRLFAPLGRGLLAAVLLCTAWAAQAQNLTVRVNATTKTGQASLQAAIEAFSVELADINSIRISAGTFTAEDWAYLKTNCSSLIKLDSFTITKEIEQVADLPNASGDEGEYFPTTVTWVKIHKLKKVGKHGFKNCTRLLEAILPDVEELGATAFLNCQKLTNVNLPNVSRIEAGALANCAFATIDLPKAASIGGGAFSLCKKLTTITLPEATTIGDEAFKQCEMLQKASLPKALIIGSRAFIDCEQLKVVSLPKATSIGQQAFSGCVALSLLELSARVPVVNDNAFENCAEPRYLQLLDAEGNLLVGDALATARQSYMNVDAGWDATTQTWHGWQLPTFTLKVNGGETIVAASLQAAIESCKIAPISITSLEILEGDFTTNDWEYLKANIHKLYQLQSFTIADGIGSVADMPDTDSNHPYFSKSIASVSIDASFAIGAYAFYYCDKLSSISLPKATSIGGYAFYSCDALTAVELPEATSIGMYAFYYCEALTTVNLPKAASIGQTAFSECYALTTLSLPEATSIGNGAFSSTALTTLSLPKATSIGNNAFAFCPALTTVELPEAVSIGYGAFGECTALTTATLPSATSIGENAFYTCTALTFLRLGSTVPQPVGDYAFNNCPSPRYLQLVDADGNPLTGKELTTAAANYRSIDDGDDGDNLWYGWSINEQPAQITIKVNDGEEMNGSLLQAILADYSIEPANVSHLEVLSGNLLAADVPYMKNSLTNLKKLTLTAATEFNLQLSHDSLQEVYAPLLETVGENAFYRCSALTTVSLPKATSIGRSAFYECSALTTVSLPEATSISQYAFYGCSALTTVSLPKATSIGQSAFNGCSVLTTLSLPKLTSIDNWAFDGCNSLIFLKLASTPPTVKNYTFSSYLPKPRYLQLVDADGNPLTGTALTTAVANYKGIDDGDKNDNLWYGWSINEQPAQITIKVNDGEEMNGSLLQAILADNSIEPANVSHLEVLSGDLLAADVPYMKNSLTNLKKLTLTAATEFNLQLSHDSLQEVYAPLLETVGKNAFAYCTALTTVELPKATSIGNNAFDNCSALTTVELPEAVSIGGWAFCDCSSLTSVSLPKAASIKNWTFSSCSALTTLSLPEATSIESYAIPYCEALTTLSLPKLNSIGSYALEGCNSLIFLKLGSTAPASVVASAFNSCPRPRYLQLVDADGNPLTGTELTTAVANYKSIDDGDDGDNLWYGWSINEQPAQITIKVNDGEEMNGSLLQAILADNSIEPANVSHLEVLSGKLLGADVTYMKNSLTNLKKLTLTDATEFNLQLRHDSLQEVYAPLLETVVEYAFAYCTALTTVKLPAATVIGQNAFNDCTALSTVSLPAATSIGSYAFAYCQALRFLELGATAPTTVETDAFAYCPSWRYLMLVDAEGNLLTGDDLTAAQDNYMNDAGGWNAAEETWHGWTMTKAYALTLNAGKNGKLSANFGSNIIEGAVVTLTATPADGFKLKRLRAYLTDDASSKVEIYNDNQFTMPAHNVTVEAEFEPKVTTPSYTLTYTAGNGGYIMGLAQQTVKRGQNGQEVEAIANKGYRFVKWSDGVTTAKRTDTNVQKNISATAEFEEEGSTGLFNNVAERLNVYPNPTRGSVQVEATGTVLLYNTAGQLLQRVPSQGQVQLDLSGYPDGMYFIHVGNAVAKVVKK